MERLLLLPEQGRFNFSFATKAATHLRIHTIDKLHNSSNDAKNFSFRQHRKRTVLIVYYSYLSIESIYPYVFESENWKRTYICNWIWAPNGSFIAYPRIVYILNRQVWYFISISHNVEWKTFPKCLQFETQQNDWTKIEMNNNK